MPFMFGLDLAETTDYTAGGSIRPLEEKAANGKPILLLGDLFRFRLGTSPGEIADEVAAMMRDDRFAVKWRDTARREEVHFDHNGDVVRYVTRCTSPTLLVDITGIGWSFRELLRDRSVYFESIRFRPNSETYHYDKRTRTHNVPKMDMIAALLVAWTEGELQAAPGLELWPTLREELVKLRRKQNERTGYMTVEHWREKDHDDLVFAVAMAVWWVTFRLRRRPTPIGISVFDQLSSRRETRFADGSVYSVDDDAPRRSHKVGPPAVANPAKPSHEDRLLYGVGDGAIRPEDFGL